MKTFSIKPVDTWFFRDGTPYSIDTASQIDVGGPFPPSPLSTAGALRATLAMASGWSGFGTWPIEFNPTLGNGPDDLGRLRIQGPFVTRDHELLLPVPRHLCSPESEGGIQELRFARVGKKAVCDLGAEVRLPGAKDGAMPASRVWVKKSAFEMILDGKVPFHEELIPEAKLWTEEPRTGIKRDLKTRAVSQGMLYSSRHFRLLKDTALVVCVSGLPPDWPAPHGVYPFGGESRLGDWQEWPGGIALRIPFDRVCAEGRFILIAVTPLNLSHDVCCGRAPLTELGNAQVISACMDRPMRIGGWDSLSQQPRPMRSYVPPGTVLFCQCQDKAALRSAIDQMRDQMPLPAVGGTSATGFGCVALGTWVDVREPA